MHTFSIRDLREHIGDVIHSAEAGDMALITKRGKPVFLAVPFNDLIIDSGLHVFLAMSAYKAGSISLGKAAKMAKLPLEDFIERLGESGIPVVNYEASEVETEFTLLKSLKEQEK